MQAVEFLQIMLYILGSILLVVLIVLGIRLTVTMNKVDNLVDNINRKVNQLNGVFSIIDTTTNSINLVSDRIVDGVSSLFSRIFSKKKKEDDIDE